MAEIHTHDEDAHDSAFHGLLVNDANWAFGTDFEDPLAGVDTTVPDGVEPHDLALYCLMLADDALIYSHRLSEWTSFAPDLEEDLAVANVALDLLGQARLLLARAAAADPSIVPALPEGSPVPPEDALAFFRGGAELRNVRLAEVPNGDFAELVARLLVFSSARLALFERLVTSRDAVLAAVAAKGVKEMTYHRDFSGRWFLTLAGGTEDSRSRLEAALVDVLRLESELFETHEVEARVAAAGVGVDPSSVAAEVGVVLSQVFAVSGVEQPQVSPLAGLASRKGRDGAHTEALSRLLAEMQVVAREHPEGQW